MHTYSHASMNYSVNCLAYYHLKVNIGTNGTKWSFMVRKKWDRNEVTEFGQEEVTGDVLVIKEDWEGKERLISAKWLA